jgi:hypothetical protein
MPEPTDVQYRYLLDATDFQKGAADASAAQADIGTAAQNAAATTQAANSAMTASAATLRAQIDQNRLAMAQLSTEVANLRVQKQALNNEIAMSISEIGLEADETKDLIKDAAMLNGQIGQLTAQKSLLSAQTQILVTQLNQEGDAAGLTTRQMIMLSAATSRVAGESIPGARAFGMLAGSMSMANLPMLAMVVGGGLLAAVLMSLFKAKDELVTLNAQGIDQDIQTAQATKDNTQVTTDFTAAVGVAIATGRQLQTANKNEAATKAALSEAIKANAIAQTMSNDLGVQSYEVSMGMSQATLNASNALDHQSQELATNINARQKAEAADRNADNTLVHLYETTGQSVESLVSMARQLGATEEEVTKFKGMVETATSAVLNFNAAVAQMKVAEANLGPTTAGLAKQAENLGSILGQTKLATNNQTDADVAALTAGNNLLKNAKERVNVMVGEGTVLSNHAAQMAALSKIISGYTAEEQASIKVTEAADAANKNWTEHAHKGGAAARAMSNELITLKQKLDDAKAAADPLSGSFDAQEAKIKANTTALIAHAAVAKRDSAEMISLAHQIQDALIQGVENKRLEAERKFWSEVAQIQAQGLATEFDRMEMEYNRETNAKAAELRIQLGESKKTEDDIAAYALAKWNEIGRKVNDIVAKAGEEGMKEAVKGMKQQGELLLKAIEEPFKKGADAAKTLDDEVRKITQDIQKGAVKSGQGGFIDPMVIAQDIAQMQKLGVTFQDVNAALGRSATSQKQFEQGIQMASRAVQGQSTYLDLLQQKLNETNKDYAQNASATQEWANVSATAINQMGSDISNVLDEVMQRGSSFGKEMEAMVLKLIGSMAQQWGAYYIALGIADAFTDPAASAAELAGGAALEALGGALQGIAGGLTSKSSASAGATSAVSGGGAASTNKAIPTSYIPVPTGGSAAVNITMDSSTTSKLLMAALERQGAFTIRNIGSGGNMNRALRNAVGVPVRGGA